MKNFIKTAALFSLLPVAAILLLHMTIKKTNGVKQNFKRIYTGPGVNILSEMANPKIVGLKSFEGKVYAASYNEVSAVDLETFKLKSISPKSARPLISWYLADRKLFVTEANEKSIDKVEGDSIRSVFSLSTPLLKNVPIDHTKFVYKTFDANFANENFFVHFSNTNKDSMLHPNTPIYNDGGFAMDGDFIPTSDKIIYLNYNVGRFLVFDKSSLKFSAPKLTIDSNTKAPPVVHFSKAGYRIDSKFDIVNLFGFTDDRYLNIVTNVYSYEDIAQDYDKENYIIDRYSLVDYTYKNSIRVPKDHKKYGRLLNAFHSNGRLYLVYSKKILKTSI
ncbi:hypothetical protein ABDD95_07575 [Mucilaginibacter sp. PAMB04274]|uniref:hypothetical protein n=1 Tax=Mucilaginibacter sp. PAMB04274 TaxID=3138568 RepID=UPI0031F633A4